MGKSENVSELSNNVFTFWPRAKSVQLYPDEEVCTVKEGEEACIYDNSNPNNSVVIFHSTTITSLTPSYGSFELWQTDALFP